MRAGGAAPARWIAPALVAGALLAAGCQRDEVEHFRVGKEAPPAFGATPAAMPAAGGTGAPGMQGDVPPPPTPSSGLSWRLPKGWKETRTGGMRYATLTPPGSGKVDASVVVLPGPAGGELANVNRWRNQIGLPPIDEAAMASARKPLDSPAGTLAVYDFASDAQKSRVVAGLTVKDGATWFVKLSGDADAVAAARPDFMKLLGSLRFDASNP